MDADHGGPAAADLGERQAEGDRELAGLRHGGRVGAAGRGRDPGRSTSGAKPVPPPTAAVAPDGWTMSADITGAAQPWLSKMTVSEGAPYRRAIHWAEA